VEMAQHFKNLYEAWEMKTNTFLVLVFET